MKPLWVLTTDKDSTPVLWPLFTATIERLVAQGVWPAPAGFDLAALWQTWQQKEVASRVR